jgi:hypothetical protein
MRAREVRSQWGKGRAKEYTHRVATMYATAKEAPTTHIFIRPVGPVEAPLPLLTLPLLSLLLLSLLLLPLLDSPR